MYLGVITERLLIMLHLAITRSKKRGVEKNANYASQDM